MRLAAVSKAIPSQRLGVEDCVIAAGHPPLEARAFRRIFGINEVRVWPRETGFAEILRGLLDAMPHSDGLPPDTFLYVHACPLHAHAAADTLSSLRSVHPLLAKIDRVYEIDQMCCASVFWALETAQNMLRRGASRSVLIVAGESFSDLPVAERYMPACTVLGDAYTALRVDAQATGVQVTDIMLSSNPEFHFGLYASSAEVQAFNRAQVSLTADVLDGMGFSPASDEPILPHNINSFSWDQYCARSGTPRGKVWLDLLGGLGHCCSTDAFLNLDRFLADDTADCAVLVGVGQGGFVGGCRVRKSGLEAQDATG
jgi:3-oxoacyl-[acyl-carrier-protein] synthase-3